MEKITSKNNSIIKDTKRLFSSSKARNESRLFALEGVRLCFDVLNSVYSIEILLFCESLLEKYKNEIEKLIEISDKAYIISEDIAQKLSETKSPQGIFALVKMKETSFELENGKYIALDGVQDPSNVGAIIRSAEALGIDGIVAYNSCDIFNPKAIRATMGSVLRMSIMQVEDLQSFLIEAKQKGIKTYATVPDATATDITTIDFSKPSICVIGNEANGVEQSIKNACDDLVTIKMLGKAESLNASVAASITMWEMLR